jgi:flavin-binding protein dodecin
MSFTLLQLANRTLVKLGIVGIGQSPEAEDTAAVEAVAPAVFSYLEAKRVYTVSDTDAIDDGAFEWLVDCVGFFYAADLAGGIQTLQTAEFMLKAIGSTEPTYQPMTAEHF